MTRSKFESKIAKAEGKKIQVRIGDVREIVKIVIGIAAEEMVANGLGFWRYHSESLLMLEEYAKAQADRIRRKQKRPSKKKGKKS